MSLENPTSEKNNEIVAERELNEYADAMKNALADLAAEKAATGQPSDVRTVFIEGLKIMGAVDLVIGDIRGDIDVDALQATINSSITMLGLAPAQFSLKKLDALAKAVAS